MPLFTKFKKAKDAAVEHKKSAAAEQEKPPAPPYRHVPTHAKQDALATQPTVVRPAKQPTTLRPAELQARIAAARESRAASWQSSVASPHSVYHSCPSSRSSSRASSTTHFPSSSRKGKGSSAESIDTILGRSQSLHRTDVPTVNGRRQHGENFSPLMSVPVLPPPATQRPRPVHARSRRSSFTKRKSPLSTISMEEEPDEMFSRSSNTSEASTQSSATNDSRRSDSNDFKDLSDVVKLESSQPNKQTALVDDSQPPVGPRLVRRKSKWSLFQRKNIDIAAH